MKNRTCPKDEQGNPTCDYYYEQINTKYEEDDHWMVQYCKNCNHILFIDKNKLKANA